MDASTYPLLDNLTGDFVGEAVRHGLLKRLPTFGALVGAASDLPTLAGAAGVKALLDRNDALKEIQGNQLSFYHRAGEGLEARRG